MRRNSGIAHTGILQDLEMSNFDKTRPACQWDYDSGWKKTFRILDGKMLAWPLMGIVTVD